jgi:hypothetical protein
LQGSPENPASPDLSAAGGGETLVAAWERLLSELPEDWSGLYAELEPLDRDALAAAALTVSPLNPERCEGPAALRFRVARNFGYGAAPEMARRCLERLDEEGARGSLRLLELASDDRPVETQGQVWRLGGRSL